MASSYSANQKLATLISLTVIMLISPAHSLSCSSQVFKNKKLYPQCADLPTLDAQLHWSYDSANSTLAVAFSAPPAKPEGYIAWGINPTKTGMEGAQALVAAKFSSGGLAVKTFNITGVSGASIIPGKIAFEVWDTAAESSGKGFILFAKLKVKDGKVNHVWQVGPSILPAGIPAKHAFDDGNLQATGSLTLAGTNAGVSAGDDSKLKNRNIHGILNVVSWGFLFIIGIIIARTRTIPGVDPLWFYLHVSCQITAYAIGVAGWATGMKIGNGHHLAHRNIGITLVAFCTIQMSALFLRPAKDHKHRIYWNFFHHFTGYFIITAGIINVFRGISILKPADHWKITYIVVVCMLAMIIIVSLVRQILVGRKKA